jgi:peptidoglycan-associated lipoprotein
MKSARQLLFVLGALCLVFSSCQRTSDEVWDDTKSAGRHVGRGFRSLGGKQGNSRQISNREEFCLENDRLSPAHPAYCEDYIPLPEEMAYQEMHLGEGSHCLSYQEPGGVGSSIPGIEAFSSPVNDPALASVFRNVYFSYNSNLVKGEDNFRTARGIAGYLKSHPRVCVFIEGHCDERGPAAYNLALGVRRSNAVRDVLIGEGVDPARLFTISYGKERPIAFGKTDESWSQNRRAEFKIYQK